MTNDKIIIISTGQSRKATLWYPQTLMWSDFVQKLSVPVKTSESYDDYIHLPKSQQDDLKDVGGFVGGTLKENRRSSSSVIDRHIVTLDADSIPAGETQIVINKVASLGCAFAIYSTRKHSSATPRLRIILPLDRPASADEYEPVARKLAGYIGLDYMDPTTFQASRLMYWPSISQDGEYVHTYEDKPWCSVDGILGQYTDWHDQTQWPQVPGEAAIPTKSAKKQGDPLQKTGIVGAFCKTYNIEQAIAVFLDGVYTPCVNGRYTYTEGSTVGGAVLYQDGNFLYSNHATDPCSGRLVNSFDLVRLHKFGELDYDAALGTPTVSLPSYKHMIEFATSDPDVTTLLTREKYETAAASFDAVPVFDLDASGDWLGKIKVNGKGEPLRTIDNILLILNNDPKLAGKIVFDKFANRVAITGNLPWRECKSKRFSDTCWRDTDDSGLRYYLECTYGITGKDKIFDGFALCAEAHSIHRVKDYLQSLCWDGVKRIDSLLIDYLGAQDSLYTREACRKTLIAAVARIMQPGVKFDNILILAGKQGAGKSTFAKVLGGEWHNDSLHDFRGKEACEQIQGYWIIELGELTGFSKAESNEIKQFVSRQEDVYREPYGRRTGSFPRQCIFIGTTNDNHFLRDLTGNRRFWPVDIGIVEPTKDIFTQLVLERDQIWAEAVAAYMLGESVCLSKAANSEAVDAQESHSEINPKVGVITEFLERKIPSDWYSRDLAARRAYWGMGAKDTEGLMERDRICAAEIWCECFLGDIKAMKRSDAMEINSILAAIPGWCKNTNAFDFRASYGRQRGFIKQQRVCCSAQQK